MRLDLTKQYSELFVRGGKRQLIPFARDVAQSGKLRELSSFVVWELLHQLRLFPKSQYLQFTHRSALSLHARELNSADFHKRTSEFFERRQLSACLSPRNWKLLVAAGKDEIFGCFYPNDCDLYRSIDNGASITFLRPFPKRIKAVFVSRSGTIFVCVKGSIYRSSDRGASFRKSLDFASPESFFRFNNAMTEMPDGTLIIGEYGNVWDHDGWRKLAYLYFSSDEGETWYRSDFLIRKGTNKHVHTVKYSELLGRLLITDGDNYKKLWLQGAASTVDPWNLQFTAINRFHIQMGGYTCIAEVDGKLLFGTDYQGGTNFVVGTRDGAKYVRRIIPDPYRRSPIDTMVRRKGKNGTEVWANLPFSTAGSKCLLMYTADGGESWNKVIEYNAAAFKVWLLNSSDEIPATLYFSIQDMSNSDRVVYKITDPD